MKKLIAGLIIFTYCFACNTAPKILIEENEVPAIWADMTLYITKNTPANSPTFASRVLGYTGLTMYESVVKSSPVHASLGGQLNQLPVLPAPEKNKQYNWALSLNAAQAAILRSIYIQTSKENKKKIDSLESVIYRYFSDIIKDRETAERSVAYGKAIASSIFEWSKTDGGHRGYLFNFDSKMNYPSQNGSWKPPFFAQQISRFPLHPHWGNNRTFLQADTNWKMPVITPYDTTKLSDCYRQFMEVYVANKTITPQQKEIALWWNDDPSETYTPPGHSYNLATTVVKTAKPDLLKAAETYARVGLAVADAFVVCWRMKYNFFSERPSTYVNENIDADWDPFWPDPPFPAFPSGHATQASAAAVALGGLYGDTLNFTDSSHVGRPRDIAKNVDYKPRQYQSFWQVAEETAYSRFLGGIHTMQDNNVGLLEGSKIGHHIKRTEMAQLKTGFLILIFFQVFYLNSHSQKFIEVAGQAGINHRFIVYEGSFGGGACVFDFNNDGYEDLFIAGGMAPDVLYLNKKNGIFENIYERSGLNRSLKYVTQGAVSADVNKDGWRDLFIVTINTKENKQKIPRAPNLLFINNGNGTFRDATGEYGLEEYQSFSTAAMFGDVNHDGYPDLYVGNYFKEFEGKLSLINDEIIVNSKQMAKGYLLINKNGKRFIDKYAGYGMTHKGFGFGGVFTDFDNDHDLDLIINHDFGYKNTPNKLLENKYPEEEFKDVSDTLNMNFGINAMGTAVGDYNNDGWLDYFVTNIRGNKFMVNQGLKKPFVDKSKILGTKLNRVFDKEDVYQPVSWGANFADFDNDGDVDLFVANGCLNPYVEPNPDYYFENVNGQYINKSEEKNVADKGVSRGSVVFDFDNDGDLDLLVVNQKPINNNFSDPSPALLYRNDSVSGNWLKIQLTGIDSDKNGIGARVEVITGNHKMICEIDGGSSHSSQNSTIAHFGLGSADIADTVKIIWVGGKQQILVKQKANRLLKIIENNNTGHHKKDYRWLILLPMSVLLVYLFIRCKRVNNRNQLPVLPDQNQL